MVGHKVVGHKSRSPGEREETGKGEKAKAAEINSAQDFFSHVGSTRKKIDNPAGFDGKSKTAKDLIEHVGRVSDRLNLRGVMPVVIATAMCLGPNAVLAGQTVKQDGLTPAAVVRSIGKDPRYEARGEAVIKGKPTEEIVGVVNLKSIKGYSAIEEKGKKVRSHDESIQLNTYVHIVSDGGKEQNLWVQDTVQIAKNKMNNDKHYEFWKDAGPRYEYFEGSDIFKSAVSVAKELASSGSFTPKMLDKLELNGIKGGNGDMTYYKGIPAYHYSSMGGRYAGDFKVALVINVSTGKQRHTDSEKVSAPKNVTDFSLYPAVAAEAKKYEKAYIAMVAKEEAKEREKQETVYINFSIAPVKNGEPDLKKMVTFDRVSYYVHGLGSADIKFGRFHDTALVLAGVGNGAYFHAKQVSGSFSMLEKVEGRLVPLKVSGGRDWTTDEGDVGVRSMRLNSYTVELIKAKKGGSAGN